MAKYYVSEWVLRRKAEILGLPDDFAIHGDYLKEISKERIVSALRGIRQMMADVFRDILIWKNISPARRQEPS